METEKEKKVNGRPPLTPEGGKKVNYYLNRRHIEEIKKRGGSKWITKKIKEELGEKQEFDNDNEKDTD